MLILIQNRLFDDRLALLVEEEKCFKIVNGEEIKVDDRGRIYSSGKGLRNWDKFEKEGIDENLPIEECRESFIQEVMRDFELQRTQIKWIPFDVNKTGRLTK